MNAIIIDDEPLAIDSLTIMLNQTKMVNLLNSYTIFDPDKETDILKQIDIVFLDIEMPEMNGLELAEKIYTINPNIEFVFVTAHEQYVTQAYELNITDYILKPVHFNKLITTVNRIQKDKETKKEPSLPLSQTIHIHFCGAFAIHINNMVEDIPWRTSKSQELFLYLLHHQDEIISKSDLASTFWPKFNEERVYSQLYNTVYHARKALSKWPNHFQILNHGNGYCLTTKQVEVDVFQWEEKFLNLPPLHRETIKDYEEVLRVCKGNYLPGFEYKWLKGWRKKLEQKWLKGAFAITKYFHQTKNTEAMEHWLVEITKRSPLEMSAHLKLMKLYAKLGYGVLVDHQFRTYDAACQQANKRPSKAILVWYNNWKELK
ncbi:response regulator [Ornithinibacillus sp. 4-3]|uniref:Response regulator n=1 Tax=Ornithinibacillus sp. 4-3 TaxID=3231488 RepID=A0AB39HUE4_9BACI